MKVGGDYARDSVAFSRRQFCGILVLNLGGA
jgi:hypothetical protein